MMIHRLSESAVRAIGSCQTLTESSSLVKELIDNALDANATSITVELSANALDVVQAKDNGHGIAPEDRGVMAVRYSTSKIIDLQELKSLGGRSLGFRGEALSAACQMAGKMVITTRVEGEGVAEACWIDKEGNIETRERASHPVGTTVRILDFLKNFPVRRENALKNSTKTLTKIKRTMQAYAFARPDIHFSLKILKSGKGNLSYALKRKSSPQLDLGLIIGKDAAGQCMWLSYPPPTQDDGEGVYDNTYSIEAFIPKPGADLSKVSGKGQFISVDSRPVSCARGTLKQISSLYRTYLRSANQEGAIDKLTDPFIRMNFVCPLGSYDVNIEPAKDDVLFEEPSALLFVVEEFFRSVYGDLKPQVVEPQGWKSRYEGRNGFDILLARKSRQTEPKKDSMVQSHHSETAEDVLDEMLMGGPNDSIITVGNSQAVNMLFPSLGTPYMSNVRTNTADRSKAKPKSPSKDDDSDFSAKTQSPWKFNMYGDVDEDDEDISPGHSAHDEAALAEVQVQSIENSNTTASNQWTIAKMNSPAHPVRRGPLIRLPDKPSKPNIQVQSPARIPQQVLGRPDYCDLSEQKNLNKKTTRTSLIYPSPQSPDFSLSPVLGPSSPPSGPPHEGIRQSSIFTSINKGNGLSGTRSLDTWIHRPRRQLNDPMSESRFEMAQAAGSYGEETPSFQGQRTPCRQPRGFVSARTLPQDDLPADESHQMSSVIPRISIKKRQGFLNKPSLSPIQIQSEGRNWFRIGSSQGSIHSRPGTVKDPTVPLAFGSDGDGLIEESSSLEAVPVHPDPDELLDYERRKFQAAKRVQAVREAEALEGEPNGDSITRPTSSPHSNRYQAAKAALASIYVAPPSFGSGDPRAYLIRLMRPGPTGAAMPPPRRLGRAKTVMLPLETVPSAYRVHDLSTVIRTIVESVEQVEKAVALSDAYVISGKVTYAFPSDLGEVSEVEAALREMIHRVYRSETGEVADLNIDLKMLMRNDDLEV